MALLMSIDVSYSRWLPARVDLDPQSVGPAIEDYMGSASVAARNSLWQILLPFGREPSSFSIYPPTISYNITSDFPYCRIGCVSFQIITDLEADNIILSAITRTR